MQPSSFAPALQGKTDATVAGKQRSVTSNPCPLRDRSQEGEARCLPMLVCVKCEIVTALTYPFLQTSELCRLVGTHLLHLPFLQLAILSKRCSHGQALLLIRQWFCLNWFSVNGNSSKLSLVSPLSFPAFSWGNNKMDPCLS